MKTIKDALEDLKEMADEASEMEAEGEVEAEAETGALKRRSPSRSQSRCSADCNCERLEGALIQLQRTCISLHVLAEALADLGAVLDVWNSDMIRTACDNVAEFDRLPGDSREIIAERQKTLRRMLKDEIKKIERSGAIRHSHL